MGRPAIYTCEEERKEADLMRWRRYNENHRDIKNVRNKIRYYQKCLLKDDLTKKQRDKYNLKLFELNNQLNALRE